MEGGTPQSERAADVGMEGWRDGGGIKGVIDLGVILTLKMELSREGGTEGGNEGGNRGREGERREVGIKGFSDLGLILP